MSETEQSWSFSKAKSNMQRGRVLVCAMALHKPRKHWPMDNRAFTLAVRRLTEKGNPVAKSIRVFDGRAGWCCPDFDEMLSHALSSCLIEYLAPDFKFMVLGVGPNAIPYLTRDVSKEEMTAAVELVAEFWKEVMGE
jgi:hypothetical protein